MFSTSGINPSDSAKSDTDHRQSEFAHILAKRHKAESDLLPNQKTRKIGGILRNSKPNLFEEMETLEKTLSNAIEIFKAVPTNDLPVFRAGEWMLDNFYVLKQTFRQIEENLPTSFLNHLPKLTGTSLPRIFALAWEWIGYSQSQLNLIQTSAFLQNYQQIMPLTIGELWALPSMLRIGILERLVYAVVELTGIDLPKGLSEIPIQSASPTLANETVVANCFLSLRLLSSTDWETFFEQNSRVEQILRDDPAAIYTRMDFDTRNSYRNVVEELTRYSTLSEEDVAHTVVELARSAGSKAPSRQSHVGFYLQDAGRKTLEAKIHYQTGLRFRIRHALLSAPTLTYLGSIAIFSFIFVLGMLTYTIISGGSLAQLIFVGLLGSGLALEAAVILVNWHVTHRIKPQSLPRMDFSEGIPSGYRTMVVVPCLLQNTVELNHLLPELELYCLSNPDPQLTFALLTDFADAPVRDMPDDGELLVLARTGVDNLNKKYARTVPFYLFHRQRQWNPSEGVWMGWERKRGKLADFNHLLLNLQADSPNVLRETAYTTQVGDKSILTNVKYVITLDADTSLPKGSANRLIATLAHPLNQAEFAPDGCSVVAGYTVMQPRVEIKPTSANLTPFSQTFAMNAGFDLYSFAVSDVYQDLFNEGSYVGKGIYDVAAFERSLAGQVRQNTLLSHDLFEGIHGRAALVTDITLYEDYPSRYMVYAHRLRRWIRGDWQLLPWLFPTVRTKTGMVPNRLVLIDRWKIFDNLRRSLVPANLVLLLSAGWLYLPGSPLIWTVLVLLPSVLPIAIQAMKQGKKILTLKQFLKPIRLPLIRWILHILFLPYEAWLALNAISVTMARMFIIHKHMLQWTTAARAARSIRLNSQYGTWMEMGVSSFLSILLVIAIIIFNRTALWVALPILIAWLIAPHIAYQISQPITHITERISDTQRRQILRLARRTWAFFEQFAGPNDHWLPPDHFQESPRGNVAHYTTPTNIGLFLVSTLSAYDLGYIDLLQLEVRLRSTFETIEKMEHYRGHLMNWYDSHTLTALPPRYVSTVDSGNLAACLITLRQGCLALKDAPLLDDKQWQGLLVLMDILAEVLQALEKNNPHTSIESLKVELTSIYVRVSAVQNQPSDWKTTLDWLSNEGWERVSHRLMELLENHPHLQRKSLSELELYLDLMYQHLQEMQRSLDLFAPWLKRLDAPTELIMQTPAWKEFRNKLLSERPTLGQATETYERIEIALEVFKAHLLDNEVPDPTLNEAAYDWCQNMEADLSSARLTISPLLIGFRDLAAQAKTAVNNMDFRFLFNEHRQLFHIGYTPNAERLDPNYYDLLASESRIASLIAIAKGDVPQSHWQHLGRPMTEVNGKQVLLSWSGTMFEYLMPTLFAKNYAGTFLSDACYAALDAQKCYGQEQKVPWGISESSYFAFDLDQNYQYRAFGVPSLGFKRDLSDDLVIAPYASLMGLSLQPQAVLENMVSLEKLNMFGRFGFYEALDYTKARLPDGQSHAIVQSYMAHHQGMILLATANFLLDDVMVERFHADEHIQSVELLLQEKIPQNPPLEFPHTDEQSELGEVMRSVNNAPWRVPIDSPIPQVHLLSQGDASLMITNAGSGFSQWREFALTRWHADSTLDQWGTWIYVQDRECGALWSATSQPIVCKSEYLENKIPQRDQEVWFYPHKVEFQRSDNGITLRTGITVSVDGVEIRRVNILNNTNRIRKLKLTSYGEVVLAAQAADRRHPAFNKLFIESEYLPRENALLFQRRPRSANEKPVVMIHAMIIESGRKVTGEYETDRAQFLGRSQNMHSPSALENPNHHLSGTVGGTLDPILSLAQEIDLKPHAKTRVSFLTLAAGSRAEALEKLSHYQSGQAIYQAFNNARTQSEKELLEQGLDATAVEEIQRVLSALLYPSGRLRAAPHILAQNEHGQSGLWAFGISGDHPILLLRVYDGESSLLVEALQAFNYWRSHHITVNLVILNEEDTGYALDLNNTIQRHIIRVGAENSLNQRDGIFVLRSDQLQPADKILLKTVAGVILDEKSGTLAEHARRLTSQTTHLPEFIPSLSPALANEATEHLQSPNNLLLDNTLGGFSPDGREYVIHLLPGQHTPHPWINVIANPQFGFLVSEVGSGPSWAGNSGENRLTPWRNDPVTDMPGEVIYLRDEETGLVWSPTLMPAGANTTHIIRHGAGYSIFESQSHGLNQNLCLFAAPDAPVKIARLNLKNLWKRPRRITITYYAEWVLGTTRDTHQAYIMPEFDPERHALLAKNRYNSEFGERVAFLAASKTPHGITTDRTEFLGRKGSLRTPAALGRIGLKSKVIAGVDPCAVIQLHVDLQPGATEEVFFLVGEGENRKESLALIEWGQAEGQIETIWQSIQQKWDKILGNITVETPEPGMDLMLNHWLLYQTLSCRLWGRTALYQSSGAFGFRDQLQDVMALLHTRPDLVRAQILTAARHQFEAGDVLHWWNPPAGRGVRTRISDDLLWLPYVTAEYVTATGDESVLIEKIPFLLGELLKPEEEDRYSQFEVMGVAYTLYEHCRRALEKGATTGAHGLPLMGAGDWNDGMNRVGVEGRGESIWLGWFLNATLKRFAQMVEIMKEDPTPYLQKATKLSQALEAHAWDGEWYLRAFYDDGSRLGSHKNNECQIDSIAQSWAILSGAADPARAKQAIDSVNRLLVNPDEQMILLFTPPFDKSERDSGYIKGYLPGVRENGGQYSHAAIWTAWAFTKLGQGEQALKLFQMLNPINHASTPEKVARYKVEPYVIAADIYSQPSHIGMGGWTWYTGSCGWMYRLGIEAILGISLEGNALKVNPCIPKGWHGFKVGYRFRSTYYKICVENPKGVNRGIQKMILDGKHLSGSLIPLVDDGQAHDIQVLMGFEDSSTIK